MAADPLTRLLIADEFLQIDFGPDAKAELDEGVIRMMAGGTRRHAQVQRRLFGFFIGALRGGPCEPFGSDMAVRTRDRSIRYPDLTVDCGTPADDPEDRVLRDPRVIVEILSPSTRRVDEGVKLTEYRTLPGVDTILLVDPDAQRCRVLQRAGPETWIDTSWATPHDIELPALGLVLPHDEIFMRD